MVGAQQHPESPLHPQVGSLPVSMPVMMAAGAAHTGVHGDGAEVAVLLAGPGIPCSDHGPCTTARRTPPFMFPREKKAPSPFFPLPPGERGRGEGRFPVGQG